MNAEPPTIGPIETKSTMDKSMGEDADHLRLLVIFHYILAGLTALFAMFPLIHLAMGLFLVFGAQHMSGPGQAAQPVFIGFVFIIMACVIILLGLTMATLILVAGRSLSQRKRYTFCFVMACLECLFMPFGTVLGVFTIIVLNRPTVKQLFSVTGHGS